MRGFANGVVRGVVAVSLLMALAVPAQAKPGDGTWLERKRQSIVKLLKQFGIRSFGDGLTDPRP
jgi:hypothetical protein